MMAELLRCSFLQPQTSALLHSGRARLPAEEASIRDRLVFGEMIRKNGNISRYLGNEEVVERPNNRIQYDREKQEWRRAGQVENL